MDRRTIIEKCIPSESYKKFLQEKQIELNAKQKAKLIYRFGLPIIEKWDAFRSLIETEPMDEKLKRCLEMIVSYEEAFVKKELEGTEGCVYSLQVIEPEDCEPFELGVFASMCDAERLGRKTGNPFEIIRHEVKPLSEKELSHFEQQIADHGFLTDMTEQCFHYDRNGQLTDLDLWKKAGETESREREQYEAYNDADYYLCNLFADFPNCYENGDLIRSCVNPSLEGYYGIVHVFPDWEERKQRITSQAGMEPDDEMLVEFLFENGKFGHEHIIVTDLEKVEPDEIPEKYREVLCSASQLVCGKDTIEDLQYALDRMSSL